MSLYQKKKRKKARPSTQSIAFEDRLWLPGRRYASVILRYLADYRERHTCFSLYLADDYERRSCLTLCLADDRECRTCFSSYLADYHERHSFLTLADDYGLQFFHVVFSRRSWASRVFWFAFSWRLWAPLFSYTVASGRLWASPELLDATSKSSGASLV